jgi:hypothetical protein
LQTMQYYIRASLRQVQKFGDACASAELGIYASRMVLWGEPHEEGAPGNAARVSAPTS